MKSQKKEHAYDLANADQLKGYKLVAGRNSRKWNKDDDVIKSAFEASERDTSVRLASIETEVRLTRHTLERIAEKLDVS